MVSLTVTYEYCHCREENPLHEGIATALRQKAAKIRALRDERYARSQDVERELHPEFLVLGFTRSATAQTVAGLFSPDCDFEIDFFSQRHGVGVEIEKGKHFSVWRNLVKFCESPLVQHGVLILPYEKHGSQGADRVFDNTVASLKNVRNLYEHLDSLLCFGY